MKIILCCVHAGNMEFEIEILEPFVIKTEALSYDITECNEMPSIGMFVIIECSV